MNLIVMEDSKIPSFQKDGLHVVLFYISNNLNENDTKGLKFLLRGKLNKNVLAKPLQDVFSCLEQKKMITQENVPWIIVECLQCIGQLSLIGSCFGEKYIRKQSKDSFRVDRFRRVLYTTGMDLTEKDWKSLMFLFGTEVIPKSFQEKFESALDLFLFLEEKKIISTDNTKALQEKLEIVERIDLSEKLAELHGKSSGKGQSRGPIRTEAPVANGRKRAHPALTNNYSFRLKNSVIKGIHVHKLNPPVAKQLLVTHEPENEHDDNACVVSLPDSSRRKCFVENGKVRITETSSIVGCVPKGLSSSMRYALDKDCSVIAVKTGKPCPSFDPWPPMFSKGGGLVLPCDYIFNCYDDDRKNDVMREIKEALDNMEAGVAMRLETKI